MNVQKLIVVVIAILINVVALVLFNASTPVPGTAAVHPRAEDIPTLPVIEVRPSASQMRALRRARATDRPKQADAAADVACEGMPYYSYATPCTVTTEG